MSAWSYWWALLPLAAEVVWGLIFLPRVRRFFRDPGPWVTAGNAGNPDAPPAVAMDLAWREFFVLYHLPGVAVIDTLWKVFRVRHSLVSVVAAMAVTGGTYALALRFLLTFL